MTTGHLAAMGEEKKGQNHRQEQWKQKQSNGGAFGQVSAGDAGIEGQARQYLGGCEVPAAGQVINDHDIGKREDQAEQQGDQTDWQDQRQSYLKKMAPPTGAVDRRGIMNILRNRTVPSEQDHDSQRQLAPNMDGDNRSHRQARQSQPHKALPLD